MSVKTQAISKAQLAAMIEEVTVDAHGDSGQTTGWYTMLVEDLALPFETTLLGVAVKVVALDLRGDNTIVAICNRRFWAAARAGKKRRFTTMNDA
ncbi:MAG TPA: calcium-binding protein [Casimicrobiaceae bacterium]|nr:calcium-binding protein [Casimicrobiaceae bacterium]